MNTDGRLGALRAGAVYIGLLASEYAGGFLLGAYAQGFETLDELRTRGSDGYGWTWQAALVIGLGAATLAAGIGLALVEWRVRAVYWRLCKAAAALGAVIVLTDPSLALTWIGFFGFSLAGVGVTWLASGRTRNTGGVAAPP